MGPIKPWKDADPPGGVECCRGGGCAVGKENSGSGRQSVTKNRQKKKKVDTPTGKKNAPTRGGGRGGAQKGGGKKHAKTDTDGTKRWVGGFP